MRKKLTLILCLLTFLGLAASQLSAGFNTNMFCQGQACCPDTYNGDPFMGAAATYQTTTCFYMDPVTQEVSSMSANCPGGPCGGE